MNKKFLPHFLIAILFGVIILVIIIWKLKLFNKNSMLEEHTLENNDSTITKTKTFKDTNLPKSLIGEYDSIFKDSVIFQKTDAIEEDFTGSNYLLKIIDVVKKTETRYITNLIKNKNEENSKISLEIQQPNLILINGLTPFDENETNRNNKYILFDHNSDLSTIYIKEDTPIGFYFGHDDENAIIATKKEIKWYRSDKSIVIFPFKEYINSEILGTKFSETGKNILIKFYRRKKTFLMLITKNKKAEDDYGYDYVSLYRTNSFDYGFVNENIFHIDTEYYPTSVGEKIDVTQAKNLYQTELKKRKKIKIIRIKNNKNGLNKNETVASSPDEDTETLDAETLEIDPNIDKYSDTEMN